MAGQVTHFELHAPESGKLASFYGELFGWHCEQMGPEMGNYILVDTHAGTGINGGFGGSEDGSTWSTIYVVSDDLQATLDAAAKLGGETVMEPSEVPGIVALAMFKDPHGNVIGLTKDISGGGAPGVSGGSNPAVAWFEIYTPDIEASQKFYGSLFGWKASVAEMGGGARYGMIETQADGGIQGAFAQVEQMTSGVVIWAEVDDPTKYVERAETLGAKRLMGPQEVPNGPTIAMFSDPVGAMFGVYKAASHAH